MHPALWITESDVVELLHLGEAISALERGFELQASGAAVNMSKTQVTWGDGCTLHALGASAAGVRIGGTKTWAHTHSGATPLLILWDAETGRLRAVIESFALGQMRTGGVTGVATRWMARADADTLGLIGTGKQAMAQLAAIAAVRPLRRVRVFSPTLDNRRAFLESAARYDFGFEVVEACSVAEAVADSAIVTLVTRARVPFLDASMVQRGTHINAIGAISPERQELTQDVFERADLIVADDRDAAANFSKELMEYYARSPGSIDKLHSLSALVSGRAARPEHCDLSLFKAMGMGLCDVSLGVEVLDRAMQHGKGLAIQQPTRVRPRLDGRVVSRGTGHCVGASSNENS